MITSQSPSQMLPDYGFAFSVNPKSPAREAVASFVQRWMDSNIDPARKSLPPLAGEDVIPHAVSFSSLHGSYASVYLLPDESALGMGEDARLMRHDLSIMECLEIRQRLVAELDWTIEPPDGKSEGQKSIANELTQILKSIRRFTDYRRSMQEAIWVGRAGIQHRYGRHEVGGRRYLMPKPLHQDHYGWMPIQGDKILYRFDDGRELNDGQYPHQMGIRVSTAHYPETRISKRRAAEQTPHGMAVFLKPYERETLLVHKHMIEDSDFHDMRTAGRIHGVGIRNRIWRTWILKQETLAFLMNYIERSAGGIEIWEYPLGNNEAKKSIVDAAERRSANGKNILFFPKPPGDDAALYDLKIVEPGFSGIDLINNLQEKFFGHQIKRYILGQTLTTEADATGLGSGVADAHQDTLHQIVLYDGAGHEETLTEELVRPIQLYNFPETQHWKFHLKLQFDSRDSESKLESFRTAWDMGARITEADVLEEIGAAVPTSDDRILENPAFQQSGGSPFGAFPSGTTAVSAAVHQSMGSHIGGPSGKAPIDQDGDGIVNEGTAAERPSFPDAYARQRTLFDESEHPREPAGTESGGQFTAKIHERSAVNEWMKAGGPVTDNQIDQLYSTQDDLLDAVWSNPDATNEDEDGATSEAFGNLDIHRAIHDKGLSDWGQISEYANDQERRRSQPEEIQAKSVDTLDGKFKVSISVIGADGDESWSVTNQLTRSDGTIETVLAEEAADLNEAKQIFKEELQAIQADHYARRHHRIVREAAALTHTEPTEAQAKAGNYAKGKFPWNGLQISIENPKGSIRRGTSPSGREWERKMPCHYGYIKRTKGADGDALDVYVGSHPESELVYIIKQIDKNGKFDEFKIIIGCTNWKQAKRLYLSNYPKGWKCGPKAAVTVEQFKRWLKKGGGKESRSFSSAESK